MSDWLGQPRLQVPKSSIALRPITADDTAALADVVADPTRFRWTSGTPTDEQSAASWVETALAAPQARVALAVLDGHDLVGSTSFYDIEPAHRALAIGHTFYAERAQGTAVNPTAKFLLLQHAFDTCAAVRVVWHTHEDNSQSRAAIEKLGATFEGLLRKHRRFGNGWRTTAQYAMTDDTWPAAKEALLQRISQFDSRQSG